MRVIKWILYFIGACSIFIGYEAVPKYNVKPHEIVPGLIFGAIGLGLVFLGRRIEKARREEERKERERQTEIRQKNLQRLYAQTSSSFTGSYDSSEDDNEEPEYESAAFLHYPIGKHYGDLKDEDDERLSRIDPIERDDVINKERIFWDLITFDDDE